MPSENDKRLIAEAAGNSAPGAENRVIAARLTHGYNSLKPGRGPSGLGERTRTFYVFRAKAAIASAD